MDPLLSRRRQPALRYAARAWKSTGAYDVGPDVLTGPDALTGEGGSPMAERAVDDLGRGGLQALAEAAGRDLETATAQDVLSWAHETFHDRFVIASSMADAVLAHMAASVASGMEVLFLDTGYHFPETLGTRDAVAQVYDVNVRTVLPVLTVGQQEAVYGGRLLQRDPDACCAIRKVEPLTRGLAPYTAWASGIRRDEANTRRQVGVVEWDARRAKVKVNPLATWTQEQYDGYIADNGVLVNPLQFDGYPSIGCAPCTRRVAPGDDPRSGRWAQVDDKVECGLHA